MGEYKVKVHPNINMSATKTESLPKRVFSFLFEKRIDLSQVGYSKKAMKFFFLSVIFIQLGLSGVTVKTQATWTSQDSLNQVKTNLPNPFVTGFLSQLSPGLGYFYIGEAGKGLVMTPLLVPQVLPYFWRTPTFLEKSVKANASRVADNLYFYGVYDSFQSALDLNHRPKLVVDIPHYTFSELYFAAFYPKTYSETSVLRALVFYGMMGFNLGYLTYRLATSGVNGRALEASSLYIVPLILLQSMLIGLGEETFFRGFYYPAASELFKNKWLGNIAQSLYFGACHTTFFANLGLTAFPYGLGTGLYYAPKIFPPKITNTLVTEYRATASPSDGGDLPDWQYFLSASATAFVFGMLTSFWKDGLLKTIAYHGIYDAFLILGDYLTTGNTGRFYFNVSFPY